MAHWYDADGAPLPLGVTWDPARQACNFALYSRHAAAVTLLLFDAANVTAPVRQFALDFSRQKTGRVWHARLSRADLGTAAFYGYQVDGPFDPANGFRFDTRKVLLDPYARGVFLPPNYSRRDSSGSSSNAGRGPLGEIPAADAAPFDWTGDRRPRHTHDTVIYEMHVRGFTKRANSGVSAAARGTYAGVIEKIPYLKDLGVTVVELLPVYHYDPEDGGNYWGYMPLTFFAPQPTYSSATDGPGRIDEFRAMVKALHAADIEVVLDVVYNHTSELDASGPTYSFRGIDNSTYYLLGPNGSYRNDAGTGNVMRTSHPAVRRLVTDSLRFWSSELHVDGFRFDLASVFTRTDDGSISPDAPIIAAISDDPAFGASRLIAEPWDLNVYQLGRAFPGNTWSQWNGQFRDDVRSFVKGDNGRVGDLMSRLYGSADLFPDARDDAYRPQQSVNFVTCHDGLSLYDLVSYNTKHNLANGNHNTDGSDSNNSWNCGVEGDIGAGPDVLSLRRRQMKNFCTLLMLANGTPMFLAGDEFMNTQGGNNNPYNQDNDTSWLDWDRQARERDDMFRFFKLIIAFRKAHPSIGRGRFWRDDIRWYGVGRDVDFSFASHTLAFCLHGASEQDRDIYAMINAYWEPLTFTVCEGGPSDWMRVVDTTRSSPDDILAPGDEAPLASGSVNVGPRSIVVLLRNRGT